jgi:uncharacterized membrane protein
MSEEKQTFGQNAADKIAAVVGSWHFILIQSSLLVIWIVLNVFAWINHWDPYPFILLNLALSFQAAYTAPIILMSQNRMSEKDREKARIDLETDERAAKDIADVHYHLKHLESDKLDEIIRLLNEIKK